MLTPRASQRGTREQPPASLPNPPPFHLQSNCPNPEQLHSFRHLSLPHAQPPSCPSEAGLLAHSFCLVNSFLSVLKGVDRVLRCALPVDSIGRQWAADIKSEQAPRDIFTTNSHSVTKGGHYCYPIGGSEDRTEQWHGFKSLFTVQQLTPTLPPT